MTRIALLLLLCSLHAVVAMSAAAPAFINIKEEEEEEEEEELYSRSCSFVDISQLPNYRNPLHALCGLESQKKTRYINRVSLSLCV